MFTKHNAEENKLMAAAADRLVAYRAENFSLQYIRENYARWYNTIMNYAQGALQEDFEHIPKHRIKKQAAAAIRRYHGKLVREEKKNVAN